MRKMFAWLLLLICSSANAGTLTGVVSGLSTGKFLVIKSGQNTKIISLNGSYSIVDGGAAVSVAIQPSGQLCSVQVTDVVCQNSYIISGIISGLTSGNLVLKLNNSSITIIAQGAKSFRFSTSLISGATYSVGIAIQPAGIVCLVSNGIGVIGTSNVTNISVDCQSAYTVSGGISGLTSPGLVLKLNSSVSVIPSNATSFKFSTNLTSGSPYSVSALIQPTGQNCLVSNGSGVISNSNVTDVYVVCVVDGMASLTWTKPTKNIDGTDLTDLAGYNLYYGINPDALPNVIYIPNGNTLSYVVHGLTVGQLYYFRISSINTQSEEGPQSNPASGTATL
jgi:hypothetical protein